MGRWLRWFGAACLALFPLGFIVFAGAEARWRLAHLVLAASLLGIGAVVTLWMVAVRGRSGSWPGSVTWGWWWGWPGRRCCRGWC